MFLIKIYCLEKNINPPPVLETVAKGGEKY
jgi:hypothetical protein